MKRRLKDNHRVPAVVPLAYFITLRTYGTWLHGDDRGSVDHDHNRPGSAFVEPNECKQKSEAGRLRNEAVVFGGSAAALIEATVAEVCATRGWHLFIVRMRSNHLHVVVHAVVSAERVLGDFKAWATRRLRENGFVGAEDRVWARHGSTPHLWTVDRLRGAIAYVERRQGDALK